MKDLSRIVSQAPKSKIRELFDLASGRQDVISLGIGQPDFDTPEPAIQGNIEALKKNITMYAPTRGSPELLQLIEHKLRDFNNIESNWKENVMATNGGSQAITLAMACLFNSGDELLLSSPNFVSYFYCSKFFGIKPVEVKRKDDFSVDLERMRTSITEKTKAILINSPNNPTGYVLNENELENIIEIVLENDLYLISDEVYENYLYDGIKHISPASREEMFERTVTVNAMSKMFSATGFRLGYVVANKEIIDLMEKYHQYTVAGTNHAAQYGYMEALKMDPVFFEDILKSFKTRRDLVYSRLKDMGFKVSKPRGSFYIMPSVEPFNLTGTEFSEMLIKEKGVAIVPGEIFGSYSKEMMRISFATELEKLKEAMDRIEELLNTL